MNTSSARETIACLGSSSTAGRGQAFDWIGELSRRPRNARFKFLNFGVGGDLAYDVLKRVDTVLVCQPDSVIVWVGGNDALAMVSSKARRLFGVMKFASRAASGTRFDDCFGTLVRRLKSSGARVAACSLAPIGESTMSDQPFQAALNSAIHDLSASIKRIACDEAVDYVPIFETFQVAINADPGRALTSLRFLPMYRDAFRTIVLRMSPDDVGRLNGWKFHSDGIHLNSRGGLMAADLIQSQLDNHGPPRSNNALTEPD
ncbi:SGNH/GDSL hydrolase family protein [Edaphobacter flagellatus]|uniref:SGNH/GDSL hydrolase family protein n=1 Tax=Edaphobacter flagellatus TaxID=1933044 RepID=UPI0021B3B2FE|nr:SGNH/GDSL hydrolase family protein [Edaphobacter flagellatus]